MPIKACRVLVGFLRLLLGALVLSHVDLEVDTLGGALCLAKTKHAL